MPAVSNADSLFAVKQNLRRVRMREHIEVGAAPHRVEVAAGRAVAPAVLLGDLEIAETLLRRAVLVWVSWVTGLLAGIDDGVEEGRGLAHVSDVERPPGAAEIIRPGLPMLGLLEVGQDIVM